MYTFCVLKKTIEFLTLHYQKNKISKNGKLLAYHQGVTRDKNPFSSFCLLGKLET
jgi:hypothetical protein